MTNDFDLLTQPWIPAEGAPEPESVLGVLERAHELDGISDPSPLVTFGIYRLLIAVVHSCQELPDADAWAEAWRGARFDPTFLTRVREECGGRLRLFHRERPFYQTNQIPPTGKPGEPLKSVGYLAPEASTGTNIIHFEHAGEADHAFCPACCAKGLLVLPVFAMAGGAGIKPGINGVPPFYVLPRGDNLYQTLLLNYLPAEYWRQPYPQPDPGPLWKNADGDVARREKGETGFIESLTWPPRRVRLFPGPGGPCSRCGKAAEVLVRRMVFSQGWSRPKEQALWIDAWAAYAVKKAAGADQAEPVPLRPTEDRDVWRDFPGLFLELHQEEGKIENQQRRPKILDFLRDLQRRKRLNRGRLRHEVFGLRTDMKAKVFEWRHDTFTFPPALLAAPRAGQALNAALEYARKADEALRAGLKLLFVAEGPLRELAAAARGTDRERGRLKVPSGAVNPRDPLIYSTRRDYWTALEPRFRERLLDERLLGEEADREAWLADWRKDANAAAREVLRRAVHSYDGSPEMEFRQECAWSVFWMVLRSRKGGES